MSKYKTALVDPKDGRLMCKKRHARTAVKVYGDPTDPDWCGHVVEIYCETCHETLWYNGA